MGGSGVLPAGELKRAYPALNPWFSLVGGIFLMACSGTIYLFPVYSERLGDLLGFSVSQMQTVGTFMNAGTWFSVFGGLFYDWTIAHIGAGVGPRLTGTIGVCLLFAGYGGFYLAAHKTIHITHVALAAFAFVMGQGSALLYTSALNPNTANFEPEHKGKVVGTLVCFFGLSAGLLSLVFKGLAHSSVPDLTAVLAFGLPAVSLAAVMLMAVVPRSPDATHASRSDPLHPRVFSRRSRAALFLVVAIIATVSATDLVSAVGARAHTTVACVVALAIFSLMCLLPCGAPQPVMRAPGGRRGRHGPLAAAGANDPTMPLTASASHDGSSRTHSIEAGASDVHRSGQLAPAAPDSFGAAHHDNGVPREPTLRQCVGMLDYWLLAVVFFCCIGASICALDNLDRIVDSKAPDHDNMKNVKVISTSLFSVFNTSGRILAGFASDKFILRLSRPFFLVLACSCMLLSQLWMAFATPKMLYGAFSLQGLAHGALFCMIPMLACHFFGVRHFGANFGFLGIAPAAGSELLGAVLAPKLFARACGSSSQACYDNPSAFRITLLINTGLCLVGVVAAVALNSRRLFQWNEERADVLSRQRARTL